MLRIENYSKMYKNGKKAVNNVSLHVERGDIYGFIGHNGAGKTTTIRSAVGVLDFEEGDIFINGKSIKTDPVACKALTAYIPDNPDLYDHLTGIQYIKFICDIFGVSPSDSHPKIERYADLFGITKDLGSIISSYSHGMKQKTAIIAALVHSPKLLVLDEPFVGLDPKASIDLKNIMHEFVAEGNAIFFSTHVLDVAEKLCSKIAIIKDGSLVVSGKMDEVLSGGSLEDAFLATLKSTSTDKKA